MYLRSSGWGGGSGLLAISFTTALWKSACFVRWMAGLYDKRVSYHGRRSLLDTGSAKLNKLKLYLERTPHRLSRLHP
jgi:hypothetical protein